MATADERTTCPACVIYNEIRRNPRLTPVEILAFGIAMGWCSSSGVLPWEFELQQIAERHCARHRPMYDMATETARRLSLHLTEGPSDAEAAALDASRREREPHGGH